MKKAIMLAGALLGGCASTYPYPTYNPGIEDYTIDLIIDEDVMNGYFPAPLFSFDEAHYAFYNQEKKRVLATSFVDRSTSEKEAIDFVKEGIAYFISTEYDSNLSSLDLAKKVVDFFHKELSADRGLGTYTLDFELGFEYEWDGKKLVPKIVKGGGFGGSTQTLAEFISSKPGYEYTYSGDCDDFSMALLSCYEIARNLSEENVGEFWGKLHEGLQRYQIVVMNYDFQEWGSGHSMNASITYDQDFTQATIVPIEPQCFITDGSSTCPEIRFNKLTAHDGALWLMAVEENLIKRRKINTFFNSRVAYDYVGPKIKW